MRYGSPQDFGGSVAGGPSNRGVPSQGGIVDLGAMVDEKYYKLMQVAAEQHGVVCAEDTRRLGINRNSVARWIRAGRIRAESPRAYVVAGSPGTRQQKMAVAVLSMPSLAALSHDTAAEAWGLTNRGFRRTHVVTTRWNRVRRPGVVVHESLDLIPEDVTLWSGIPITTPQRTLVDLGATSKWVVESALEQGIRHRLLTLADLEGVVARVARRGRRGVGVIRPLLEARRRWDEPADSALEDAFRRLLDDMGIEAPCAQYVLRDDSDAFVCRADFAYPRQRVLIELDSEAHHMDRIAFRRDRDKQNRAVVLGWTVLRFTWWDVQANPGHVAEQVSAALSARLSG